ncbi:MAG: transporter substrate-binding protein [Rhizobiaceae bacterium]|nr:transporter substrate-binding protein [Rhizobiaceae bacterium]
MRRIFASLVSGLAALAATGPLAMAEPSHGISMHGQPALQADFPHFPYVNPDAPKGGRINYAVQGTFDSLNPFIVQGDASRGLFDAAFGNTVFDTLMMRSRDEAFALYPLLAEKVETDAERTFVEFTLDPRAKFSDGKPVTPEDVIFTLELLRDKARPLYQGWIRVVDRMEKVGDHGIRLTFNDKADRESPLLLGLLPILPRHATDAATFDKSTLAPPVGSGPYVVDAVQPGEYVSLKRNPDYWARDIPSKRGFDNYDEIRITYIRDENTMFESFKKGETDIQIETDTGRWTTGYDFPAVNDGRVVKDVFENGLPSGMYGFVLNTRRDVFKDRNFRAALLDLFDFEWANKNLFSGAYTRTKSYYDGSELSSSGVPASDAEKALLAQWPDAVTPEIMAGTWAPASSDGSGRDRTFLKKGLDALVAAGYKLEGRTLSDPAGKPVAFEILLNGKSGEPVATAWKRTLERIGISVTIRSVDSAQYLQRQQTYDYDTILQTYTSSLSPGAEQVGRWGSSSRDLQGTYNFAGVASPAIDSVIDAMVRARERDEFVTAVRALDRLLLSGFYVVPLYHRPEQWVARWARINHPGKTPVYGYQLPTWWRDGD